MPYVQGFLVPVPRARRDDFIAHASAAARIFRECGAFRVCECWGEDVPDGETTSFPMSVRLREDETVVFSWIEWPDKATADACFAKMESEARWSEMGEMPFDGKRLVWGGFTPVVDH